jgi:hypothetical protein
MKKPSKRKRPSSLSNTAVDSINLNPNDPSVVTAKEADKANTAAIALANHTKFEAKAEAFANEFRTHNRAAEDAKNNLLSVFQTGREFIEANRPFLEEVKKFFSSNKGRKVKQTLNGHLTFETWSDDLLGVCDDYVRKVFRESDAAAAQWPFEDGMKLLNAKPISDETSADEGDDSPATPPPPPSPVKFANQLGMSIVKKIDEMLSYSQDDKLKVARILMTHFTQYAAELKLTPVDVIPDEVPATEETGTQVPA